MKCNICGFNETEEFKVFIVAKMLSSRTDKVPGGYSTLKTYDKNVQSYKVYYCSNCDKIERTKYRRIILPILFIMLGCFLFAIITTIIGDTSLGLFIKERIDIGFFYSLGAFFVLLLIALTMILKPLSPYEFCEKNLHKRLKEERKDVYNELRIFSEQGWDAILKDPINNFI